MNLQLHHVISDITGVSGIAILEGFLNGKRDPRKLAGLRDYRIRAMRKRLPSPWLEITGLNISSPSVRALTHGVTTANSSLTVTTKCNGTLPNFPPKPIRKKSLFRAPERSLPRRCTPASRTTTFVPSTIASSG